MGEIARSKEQGARGELHVARGKEQGAGRKSKGRIAWGKGLEAGSKEVF